MVIAFGRSSKLTVAPRTVAQVRAKQTALGRVGGQADGIDSKNSNIGKSRSVPSFQLWFSFVFEPT